MCVGHRQSPSGIAVAVAPAPIRPLAWEPPYATGVAVKKKKKKCLFQGAYVWEFPIVAQQKQT